MTTETSRRSPVVVPADPAWADRGLALTDRLRELLGPTAVRVEHIGSTAIPGMAAKEVFDVQVSVGDLDAAELAFAEPLADAGYELRPYRHDHVPAGLTDDPERWTKRMWQRRAATEQGPAVNLHVRLVGSPNERLALLFRDWFRAHPAAVPAYAEFKTVLAGTVDGVGVYSEVKDPVVDLVVAVAEEWAAETGWTA